MSIINAIFILLASKLGISSQMGSKKRGKVIKTQRKT